ncbi:hypothetical protein [Methanococcoides seepicolus]|uniref:Uncharacterized protein n=1 Tax=Methanococcoides seepicolus TaxID=2828780 RepID=A0A9E4ZCU9_9EURY|nr:hypothetical protein [Methanococcoides seepicolus]MCM1985747.1 hypothetical protein [Methanococcoides seepicolus]
MCTEDNKKIGRRLKGLDAKKGTGEDILGIYIYQGELSQVILKNSRYLFHIPDNHRDVE